MLAYTTYSDAEGFMQLQYDSNNLSGYLSYKELYDYINDRTER